ncbi:MAG: VanZ family protein [Clostridia bacterium]
MQTDKRAPRKDRIRYYLPRVLCVLVTAAYLCFIFSNSLENAEQSSQKSGVVTKLFQAIADAVSPGSAVREGVIRKIGHFSEFAVLGALLMVCVRIYTKKYLQNIFIPLFGSLAAGVTDEMIQLTSSGRSSEVRDVVIDFSGAVMGIIICILCVILYNRVACKRKTRRTRNGE